MIQSIKLKEMYNVNVSADGKFAYDGIKMNVKDVPIVRFEFENYGKEQIEYIKGIQKVFGYSTMLVEMHAEKITEEEVEALSELNDTCAMYVYVDVTDQQILELSLSDEALAGLDIVLDTLSIDSLCIIDKTTIMNAVNARQFIECIAEEQGIDEESVSICSSPLSCTGYACLTAVKARKLMAEYGPADDVPLPTANHERSCCGCIQYTVIEHDTEKLLQKSSTEKRSGGTVKKVKKTGISFGATRF